MRPSLLLAGVSVVGVVADSHDFFPSGGRTTSGERKQRATDDEQNKRACKRWYAAIENVTTLWRIKKPLISECLCGGRVERRKGGKGEKRVSPCSQRRRIRTLSSVNFFPFFPCPSTFPSWSFSLIISFFLPPSLLICLLFPIKAHGSSDRRRKKRQSDCSARCCGPSCFLSCSLLFLLLHLPAGSMARLAVCKLLLSACVFPSYVGSVLVNSPFLEERS